MSTVDSFEAVLLAREALAFLVGASEIPVPAGTGCARDRQLRLLLELHRANGQLWLHEDEIRAPLRTDTEIAVLRRAIEGLNQERNDRIDRLNESYAGALCPRPDAPLVTEAPGTALDRLSVLSLRWSHTRARAAADPALLDRVPLLERQLDDLGTAIDLLLGDVRAGRRRFATYQAAKLYGPPPGKE